MDTTNLWFQLCCGWHLWYNSTVVTWKHLLLAHSKHTLLVLYATPVLLRAAQASYVLYRDRAYKRFIRFLSAGIVLSIGHNISCFSVAERKHHTQGDLQKSLFGLMVSGNCIRGGRHATGAGSWEPRPAAHWETLGRGCTTELHFQTSFYFSFWCSVSLCTRGWTWTYSIAECLLFLPRLFP